MIAINGFEYADKVLTEEKASTALKSLYTVNSKVNSGVYNSIVVSVSGGAIAI